MKMNPISCRGRCGNQPAPRNSRGRATKATSILVSSAVLILMPKCPVCLAAYVTLITGASLSLTEARHLHTALAIVCGSAFFLGLIRVLRWLGQSKGAGGTR